LLLLTPKQVAQRLSVSPRTVHTWIEQGRLTGVHLSQRIVRVRAEEVEAMSARSLNDTAPSTRATPDLGELRAHRAEIIAIAAAHKASNPRVFGSVARGEQRAGSDVDLLLDFEPEASYFDMADLEVALEKRFGVAFDVGPAQDLKKDLRDRVLAQAVPL
jgi:hypothetical protein